jgi:PAS domain S-box-containing protein
VIVQLFNPENYSFTYHALGVFAAGIGIFCFGTLMLVQERSRVGIRNWIFSITESTWLLSFGMAYASRTDTLAFTWFKSGYIGFAFLPAALISLNASILQRERELSAWVRGCYGLSLAFLAALLGTDLFMKGLYHYPWGPYPAYGPVGILFICYAAVVGGTSLVLFYRAYQNSTHPRFRARQRGFLISALIGYPAFLDFLPKFGIAVYPIGYLAVSAYIVYATRIILKYRLVDITPEVATRQILETMRGAVIVEDLEGKIRVVNRTAQEMLGYGKEELLGRDLATVLPSSADLRSRIRAGERAASQEMAWNGKNGQQYEVNLSASSLVDERDQASVGIVYVAHDITKSKQAEERLRNYSHELREANKKLEALDRLKSEFVSTVSHELRTPLTSIKANAELILIKPALHEEKKHKLLVTINEESDRLSRLINDLLDLSRIEAGTVQWRREEVSLNTVLQLSINAILPLIQNKRLELKTSIAGSLPFIYGDRDRLVQVMNNLLSNAIKFTAPGGVISITARREEAELVVSVQDTGAGIPAEDIDVIFDKFHRSRDQVLKQTEGTGLGLTIARQIVEHHGGSIRVLSTYGEGTTMTFTLPVRESARLPAQPGEANL